jgi:hypothetical protein
MRGVERASASPESGLSVDMRSGTPLIDSGWNRESLHYDQNSFSRRRCENDRLAGDYRRLMAFVPISNAPLGTRPLIDLLPLTS